jgi:hypothetical protein
MDDLGPDTKVVPLRRSQELGAEDRERLASTIFADEDEYGTFSRGNLVPPPASRTGPEDPAQPDPFFDRLQSEARNAPSDTEQADVTAEYFADLDARGPAEMSVSDTIATESPPLPGSARLSAPAPARRRRFTHRAARSERGKAGAIGRRTRITAARHRAAVIIAALVLVGVCAAAVLIVSPHRPTSTDSLALAPGGATPTFGPRRPQPAHHRSSRDRPATDRHGAHSRKTQVKATAHRVTHTTKTPTTAGLGNTASTTRLVSATRTEPVTTPQPTSTTPTATTTAQQPPAHPSDTPSSASTKSSGKRSAFGAQGVLGPGHSPDG